MSELRPSKLGKKEYWEQVYAGELNNFNDIGDEGEVWFGEDSVEKMVDWVKEHIPANSTENILEVGMGNGNLLIALAEAGYTSNRLTGVDYCEDAARLARAIAGRHGFADITFVATDFLSDDLSPAFEASDVAAEPVRWDVVLDKGTYDGIALAEKDDAGQRPCDAYPMMVSSILKPGGYFLITSCNFTHEELLRTFETPETGLFYHSQVKHPVFSFGGRQGSAYCTVALQKENRRR